MIVLPTHRLFRGLPPLSSDDLVHGSASTSPQRSWAKGRNWRTGSGRRIEFEDDQGMIGLYAPPIVVGSWPGSPTRGANRMAEIAAEHSADWQGLGVAILHRLIVDDLLEAPDLPKPDVRPPGGRGRRRAEHRRPGWLRLPLAALVMPATLDHIRAISEQGERMPAKSTYFYPKLLSGLVINPLS